MAYVTPLVMENFGLFKKKGSWTFHTSPPENAGFLLAQTSKIDHMGSLHNEATILPPLCYLFSNKSYPKPP